MGDAKARPILFSAPMVRALLDGRKTQTRRGAKLTCAGHVKEPGGHRRWHPGDSDAWHACPYGVPGDLLWVRETWRPFVVDCHGTECQDAWNLRVDYAAGGSRHVSEDEIADHDERGREWRFPKAAENGNVSPLFMPRFASRLTLRITDVRVERLQDIISDDAAAEGWPPDDGTASLADAYPIGWFSHLWDSINGAGAWAANPWVWAVSFEVIQRNVNDVIAAQQSDAGEGGE